MRIGMMLGSEVQSLSESPEHRPPPADLNTLVCEAQQLEARGFASAWLPQLFACDALIALAVIGRETQRLELGTAVVPSFPRHPVLLAQQALTTQAATRGRLTLGIGLSHRLIIADMLGLSYDQPAHHLQEYLAVLTPLLAGHPATFQGKHFQVNAALRLPEVSPPRLLLAAMGPVMLGVAGRCSDGTITWMTGPRTLATHIRPRLHRAAQEAGRPEPRLIAGFPVTITHAPDQARAVARELFAIYGTLPAYRAMLDREGVADPADIPLIGDTATVAAELRRLCEIGVTDLLAVPFAADPGGRERTIDFLASQC